MNFRTSKSLTLALVVALALLIAIGGAALAQTDPNAGLIIVALEADGPAAQAGVARSDILLKLNDTETNTLNELQSALSDLAAGDEVPLTVLHGDEVRELTATLGDRNGQPYLGIRPYSEDTMPTVQLATPLNIRGALIEEIVEDSPASAAGLKVGDRVIAVNNEEVGPDADLAQIVGQFKPGDSITLSVERTGDDDQTENKEVAVLLGRNPDDAKKAYLGVRYSTGAQSDYFPGMPEGLPQMPMMPGMPNMEGMPNMPHMSPDDMPEGFAHPFAFIQRVEADSPADQAGLSAGDIIIKIDDQDVQSPADVVSAVQARKPGDTITLTLQKSGETDQSTVEVTLGENPNDAGKAYLGVYLGSMMEMHRRFGTTPNGEDMPNTPRDSFGFSLPFGNGDSNNATLQQFLEQLQKLLPNNGEGLKLPFDFQLPFGDGSQNQPTTPSTDSAGNEL